MPNPETCECLPGKHCVLKRQNKVKMVDISMWRAKIGHFHLVRVAAAMKPGKVQAFASEEKVTLTDILIFWTVVLTLVRLIFCFYSTCQALTAPMLLSSFKEIEMKGTMGWCQKVEYAHVGLLELKLAVQAPVLVTLCAVNVAWLLSKMLLSGDIEVNPGPTEGQHENPVKEDAEKGKATPETRSDLSVTDILQAIQRQGQLFQSQIEEQTKHIQQQGQLFQSQIEDQTKQLQQQLQQQLDKHCEELTKQNEAIKSELCEMKDNLKKVTDKCEGINERCNRLESDNEKVNDHVKNVVMNMNDLCQETKEMKDENGILSEKVEELRGELERMNSEVDRLEEFSRRDNLRMFGVASISGEGREGYDECSAAVCSALNGIAGEREWTERDIARAHRMGQPRAGEPRPMIVKFTQWRDKMRLLTDKALRERLERRGVRVANDLTRRQMDMVSQAKREGKAAYFVKGKMTIGPKRADPRTFSHVVAGHDTLYSNEPRSQSLSTSSHSPSLTLPLSSNGDDVTRSRVSLPLTDRDSREVSQSRGDRETALGQKRMGERQGAELRSRTGVAQAASNKQPGISGFLRGQTSSASRPNATGGSRALRSNSQAK